MATFSWKRNTVPVERKGAEICRLPVYGTVAERALSLLRNGNVEPGTFGALVASDAALAAEVLAAANRPSYRFCGRIHTVMEAFTVLGWEHARVICSTAAVRGSAEMRADGVLQRIWRHNLACAKAASQLAESFGTTPERGHMLGLLHDLGRLGLMSAFPCEYAKLLDGRHPTGAAWSEAEAQLTGFTHERAGVWLARTWGLPPLFSDAAEHHCPTSVYGRMVGIACHLADSAGFPAVCCDSLSAPDELIHGLPLDARRKVGQLRVQLGRCRDGHC